MVKQIFCYTVSILFFINIISFSILVFYKDIVDNIWILVSMIIFIFLLIPYFFSILYFGIPNNKPKEYIIRPIDSYDLIKIKEIICFENQKGVWCLNYKGKDYTFDMKGWFNFKNRLKDIIYIQFHNHFFNKNIIKNYNYYKNYFIKEINIVYKHINGKITKKCFKPSLILKCKLIIASSHFKNQRYTGNEHRNCDLYDTYLIVK